MPEWKDEIRQRLANLKLAPVRETEIVEELAQHLEDRYQELLSGGTASEEASRLVLVELTETERMAQQLKQLECSAPQEAIVWGAKERTHMKTGIRQRLHSGISLQDLKFGIRMLLKRPGFTCVALFTLAIGIGFNTAVFTVVEATLLRSLPYQDPNRLVHLWETKAKQDARLSEASYPDYLDWQQNRSFEVMAGYSKPTLSLTVRQTSEEVQGARVTANFFQALGVAPLLGRAFQPGEDQSRAERVVIISHGLWQRQFGGDRQVIGQALQLSGRDYMVVGIMPPHFFFSPAGTAPAEVWIPLNPSAGEITRRYMHWLNVIARLKPSIGPEQAQAEMNTIAQRIDQENHDSHANCGIRFLPLQEQLVGSVKPLLLVLFGAVGFVLLIACANVTNLLLVRAAARQKEIAIRMSLGASQGRLIQQLLTESLLLSLLGGLSGLLLARWGVQVLVAYLPGSLIVSLPNLRDLSLDFRVLAFTAGISLAIGLLFGLAPALQASKLNLTTSLKEGGRTSAGANGHRVRNILVITEVALALVLLIGGSLMLASLSRLLHTDPGFKTDHLLTLRFSLPSARYPERNQAVAFHERLLARLESLPGVQGVGTINRLPLTGGGTTRLYPEGRPPAKPGDDVDAQDRDINPAYFRVMGVPLLKGRYFTDQDNQGAPNVLIINQTLANILFPNLDPIGQRVVFSGGQPVPFEIVGVVGDEKVAGLETKAPSVIYRTYRQDPTSSFGLVIRTAGDPHSLAGAVRSEIQALDPLLVLYSVMSMDEMIAGLPSAVVRRSSSFLIGVFAAVALLLAMIGIYGVISYSVSEETREIGVRLALGAQRFDIFKIVIGRGMFLALIGVGIGLIAALALTRFLSSWLFQISATDPGIYTGVSVTLLLVALIACYLPARRAMRVDPMVALRYE